MNTVDRDLLGLQYEGDILECMGYLKEWMSKSEAKELTEMTEAIFRIDTYVRALQSERYFFDKIISESVSDKTRAIKRARKSEERIDDLEAEIRELKLKLEILT